MKLMSILFALAGVALMVLGLLSAAMWDDNQMAVSSITAALIAAGFAVLMNHLGGKAVTQ